MPHFAIRLYPRRDGACKYILACCTVLVLLFQNITPAWSDTVPPRLLHLQALIEQRLSSISHQQPQPGLDSAELLEFYRARQFRPVWLDTQGPLPRSEQLVHVLLNVDKEGLIPAVYHTDLIKSLRDAHSMTEQAELDIVLTDAFFHYSRDVQTGYRQPQLNDFYRDIIPVEVKPVDELNKLLTADDFQEALDDLPPKHEGYRRLRTALARYRQIEDEGGWPTIPTGPSLKEGMTDEQVFLLRERLAAEGDLLVGPVDNVDTFDDAVKLAVERFQVRHGLKVDGVVGKNTRAAMNVPIEQRIEQILLNMERWRWLPKQLGQRYIMVNTADYRLEVVTDGAVEFTMDVIIGKPSRPTPIVQGKFYSVVVNPYWTVPPTITFEDILPHQRRDPGYLQHKGLRVLRNGQEIDPATINWWKVGRNHFPYILRADPGPKNPLGQLKFLFGNHFDVYLHGTPDTHLFYRNIRALSSGCVRVRDPVKLANFILDGQDGWDSDKITQAIDSGAHLQIPLNQRLPVYLVYLTAWVGDHGGVHFRPDIYKWDPKAPICDVIP